MIKINNLHKYKKQFRRFSKSRRTAQALAVSFILVFIFADIAKLGVAANVEVDIDATPTTADVGEWIIFNWTSIGEFHSGQINFGDGNITSLASIHANSSIIHKYAAEGEYNVTLYARNNNTTSEDTDCIFIHIENNPPQFNISLTSSANEDEPVNVSMVDLVESDHDLQPGVLSYIYDFADGTQETSNQSSILHKWKNAGNYTVTITIVDDQGALDQKSQVIEIVNVDPTAMFTVDADIPPEQLRSSYYATYDFRQDIIDSEPAHWDIHDSSSVGVEKTATIKPNGDHQTGWSPSGTHYTKVDEDTPDGLTIYAGMDAQIDEFGFTTFPDDVSITQLKFYIYGKMTGISLFYSKFSWRIGGGSYSTVKSSSFGFSYSWKTITWSCELTKTELDNLRLKVESQKSGGEEGRIDIDTIYCEISYQPNTTVSIVDIGEDYKEAVKLYDEESEEQVWMENAFANQQCGTIEYYVKTTNASSITWAMSLWDSSTSLLAFQVLITDNSWKYTTGTSGTLSELGTPLNNTWYWVSIDFCVSGSYLNLSSLQFRVTVNDTTSDIYNFSSVNNVNKVRFESAIQDEGIAWIDAIGYSFDPHYQSGDNKISLISYPEKSNVLFSAANYTDTESDLSSLRFYWQFGDNSTGFGKYITHDYLTSGRYIVNLTCKDDNGAIDSHFEIVLIHNAYPDLSLTVSMENITIHEGETITFNTETLDDSTDMAQLSYWWQFDGSGFNPYNLSNCILDGWRTSNLFMEDFNDSVYLLVKDPEGAYDYESLTVTVLNVDPLISIWDAGVIANITFEVFRNSPQKDANFTFQLMADNDMFLEKSLNFIGSQDVIVYSEKELISMTLSRNWRVVVNSSDDLPASSWFRCFVRLQFLSGEELVIVSDKLYGGSYGSWDTNLNPYFYNNGDFTFMYPITFEAQIWDPSIDDIFFSLQYSIEMFLEINCSDTLPINDSFTIEYPLNDANYTVSICEEGGIKYANITATQLILSETYYNNSFPVNLDVSFTIYPIIDLFEILEVQLNLTEVSILNCVSAVNYLNASAYDDDFGVDKLNILFNTCDGIEFENLSPKLEPFIPSLALEGHNVTFYVKASDFDQTSDIDRYFTADFKSDVVPLNSDDFMMVNGSLEELGDLSFYDSNCTVFNADSTYSSPTVPSQSSDFTLISGTSDWGGDFYSIDANYTTFSSAEQISSNSEYINSITYTKGTSGPGTLASTHTDDSNYKQINAKGTWWGQPVYGYLYELEVTFNFNPSLAGRDFYLSCDIVATEGKIGFLKINGQTVSSGSTIDFDNMLIEDVSSISFETYSNFYDPFNSKIYYFELNPLVNVLNVTSSIKAPANDTTYLFYSHTTNITQAIDLKVWNYDSNQWDSIDTSNYDTFSEQIFTLNSDYYNENNETSISYYGDNSENAFLLKIDMLKIVLGNFALNFTSTLHMDNINEFEILKYLKFNYAYKQDSSELLNLSLYNFYSESWEVIDSSLVGTDVYRDKYSVLSSEFYNATYDIILRIESVARKLYLDQLKIEYYSSQISNYGSFEHETIPESPEDFTILSGSCDWDGNLLEQDNNSLVFTSQINDLNFTSKLRLRGVRPEDDIDSVVLLWAFKTNISQSINISLYDYDLSSWTLINTSTSTEFSNCSYYITSSSYYGSYYTVWVKFDGAGSSEYDLSLDKLALEYSWIKNSYQEDSIYENFPNKPDDFNCTAGNFPATQYITSITYTKGSSGGGSLINTHNDDNNYQQIDTEGTWYGQPIYGYLYELEVTFNFDLSLAGRDFYLSCDIVTTEDITGFLKVNGQTVSSGSTIDFDNMLIEDVSSITFETYSNYYDPFNSKIYYFKLVEAMESNLQNQGEEYITFTSSSEYKINFTTQFELGGVQLGDTIDFLSLNYSYKTNISQQIDISIYNLTANTWLLIESSVHLSFFNGSYSIPIVRIETNGNETIEYHDFYDSDFKIRVKVEGFNNTSSFQLFLDQLKIEYKYTSWFFTSNYWLFFDAIEEDYVAFDSTIEYYGTYSFEKDNNFAEGIAVSIIDYYQSGASEAYSKVWSELDGHTKVLKNYDTSTNGGGYGFESSHIFPVDIEYGTVELWVYKKEVTFITYDAGCPFVFRDSDNDILFAFTMDKNFDDLVRFTSNGGDTTWSSLYADDTWFRVRIDFETREGGNYLGLEQYTLNFWFDDVKKLDGVGFYKNGTINNIYWDSMGINKKADYYFDAISFSWDPNYELGLNKDESSLVNEVFELNPTDMDLVKYELFKAAELTYTFKTNISQEVTVNLYNYSSYSWVKIDEVSTIENVFYNGTYWFKGIDFINTDYECQVQIIGYNDLLNDFELHLSQLELEYTWGGVSCDIGQYDVVHELAINLDMTSQYSTMFQETFSFEAEGLYLITMTADDGYTKTKNGTLIEIRNFDPTASIGSFPNQTIEDRKIYFTSEVQVFGSNSTQSDLRYFWSFGDGLYSFEANPIHAWSEAGVYNISLTIVDCYANIYTDIKNITILEKAPEITGPFTFHGVEGQSIDLDVDIFDSFKDELTIEYKWYNSTGLFSTDKKPSVILQDGSYQYILNATDNLGQTATANISVVVEDVPPVVLVSNYMYAGGNVSGDEGFYIGSVDDPGEFELHAYTYDTFDSANLDYYWKIFKGESTFSTFDLESGIESSVKFRVKETVLYRGEVRVESANMSTTVTFVINCVIDNNGNGFSDEFEARLLETDESITAYSDNDDDCFTDLYEIGISNTSYLDPDTDGDGLFDSLDPITGIGESSARTDPLDWDCDNDLLSDGIEVLGWKISTELFGEIMVNSDPWDNNSDTDGLSDYEEYYAGTDARNPDSDNDGVEDHIDPYPMKYDGDEDGLCDGLELELGTDPNNADSDSDGLSDGEEVIGWTFKTDPLTADSDHDFVADTAEMQNYKVAIEDRYDLDEPVSLLFEINCEKAMAAQIAFLITFGEAINEPENDEVYGIQEVPDINVSIYKVDDNLLLFNMTSNKTRYFSQVVDIRETMESHNLDYRGEYMIQINDTSAGCILEQFEIEIAGYLNPNDADFDDDGIMDGVELGLLVEGVNTINFTDFYEYANLTVNEKIISNNGYDFKVISGTTIISSGSTTATITEGTDYDLDPSQDSTTCFIRITNTRLTGMGRTSGGGNQNNDDFCVRIQNPDSIATSITFERTGTANDDRVTWEILQYIGPSGGANEMIIRSVGTATCSGTTVTCDGSSISTISNSDKVVVFITGQKAADTGRGNWWESLFTAKLIGSGPYTPRFTRGKSVDSSDGVSYAVVEFTGYNWRDVQRLEISTECSTAWTTSNYNTAYSDVTIQSEGGVDLLNYTKAFMYQQYRTDNDDTDLDDAGDNVEIISTTHLRIRNSATSGNRYKVCWIIENAQSSGTVMSVEHDWFYEETGGSEENTWTESITTVASMNTTSVYAQASMDGTGTALPRGSIDYRLTATDTITFKESDNGQEKLVTYSVVQWPTAPIEPIEEPEPTIDEFYIEIPHIGRVYDADLTLKVESEGIPEGMGEVYITLIKEEINCNIEDALLIDYFGEFDDNSAFTFETSLDLSDYLNNNSISEFYGTYKLELTVLSTNTASDNFTLSEFYIQTDTFIQAEASDTEAWYTNPALADTDNDGWNDYYEIFTKSTNPINTDTDGDGVHDPYDRDPKRDVMLEINPISGAAPGEYKLVIVMAFSLSGTEDSYYMPTPKVEAHEFENSLWTAYYDGSHGSSTELHYYVNIDDDKRVQENNFDFTIQLWRVDRYFTVLGVKVKKWDKKLVNEIDTYNIYNVGHSEVLNATKYGDPQEIVYEAKIEVKTIAVEKSNTIAIYEKNGTVFNGHYQSQERMNIIQLYVNDTPSTNSPFVQGPNNIVIPTSLFTATILNGYIQNERLNETFFYSDDEEIFKFISVEREGNTEQACEEIDFVMIRIDISSSDAEKLLDLILTCVINESLDENNNTITTNATLYAHYSTKLNGTYATMMNLPYSVLGTIPWYCEFSDSPTGSQPKDFGDWFWAPLKAVFEFVGSLVITIVMLPAIIVGLIVAYIVSVIILVLLPIFAFVLWLIIRVALLILAFILLAIHIIAQVSIYLSIGISMLALTAFTGGYCNFSWNFVEFLIEDKLIRLESKVKWVYWDFFAMSFPWVQDDIKINSTTYMTSLKAILKSESNVEFNELDTTVNQTEAPPTLHCNYDQVDETTFNFWTIYDDSKGGCGEPDSEYGVRLHLIAPNGTALAPYQMGVHPDYLPDPDFTAPVKYNYTIDLSTIFPEQGLWHYYFTCKDNSSTHEPTFMPIEGYFLGPEISTELQCFLASAVSSDLDDYYYPSGFINDTFIFRAWWGCSIAPSNVSLCLVPANKTEGVGIYNTVGIRKFLMNTSEQNPNYTNSVEYNCTINFQDLNYNDDELGWFHHYYEATFVDGNKTYLYDIDGVYDEDIDIDLSDFVSRDLRQPFVTSYGPQLLDYSFAGDRLPYIINFLGKHRLLWGENRMEFEVVYLDPYGGYPLEFFPKLIFEDVVTGENVTFTTDNYWETSLSQEYGENAVSCVFYISGDELGPGMWKFRFEAKDSESNPVPTIYGYERFWNMGSILSLWDGFSTNLVPVGVLPLTFFTAAIPFMQAYPYLSIALSFGTALGGIGYAAWKQREYCKNGNIGGLLGHSIALMFASFTTAFSSVRGFMSRINSKVLNVADKFSVWYKYMMILTIIQGTLTQLPFDFGDSDFTILYDIINLPIEILTMFIAGTLGRILFSKFSGVSTPGTVAVSVSQLMYSIGTLILSIVGFLMFFIKTHAYGIFYN